MNRKPLGFTKEQIEEFMSGKWASSYFGKTERGVIKLKFFYPVKLSHDIRTIFIIKTMRDNIDMFLYDKKLGYYQPTGKQLLRELIVKALDQFYEESRATRTIHHITGSTGFDREKLEPPIHLIPVKNGVVDILSNEIRFGKHHPDNFFTGVLPVEFTSTKEEPKVFLKFLEKILPDYNSRQQIQEMFGYCLWRKYEHQTAFLLVGAGNNGRSTLMSVLIAMLGKENISAETLQDLCHNPFSKAELYHKFANITDDLPSTKIKDSSVFKTATGSGLFSAQRKFKDPFKFLNYAKLIFLANKVPLCYDDTEAYYRRWLPIFFSTRFSNQPGHEKVDKNIKDKLIKPKELSKLFWWSLEGLNRLRKQGEFTNMPTIEQNREYYNLLVSPMTGFVHDKITVTYITENYITKDDWYEALQKYCKEKNTVCPTKDTVGKIMKWVGQGIKTGHVMINKKQTYVWVGCEFNLTKEEREMKERTTIEQVWKKEKET